MTSILFRCDASLTIGSGHVMRCRTLARELQRRGAVVTFLCRRQPGDLIGLLEQEFPVLPLPEQPLAACEGLEGRDLYGAWLGTPAFQPNWFVDISAQWPRKRDALLAYASEMRPWPHARSVESLVHLSRWRGAQVGVKAAEAFCLLRELA